jgi:hypothetical protein
MEGRGQGAVRHGSRCFFSLILPAMMRCCAPALRCSLLCFTLVAVLMHTAHSGSRRQLALAAPSSHLRYFHHTCLHVQCTLGGGQCEVAGACGSVAGVKDKKNVRQRPPRQSRILRSWGGWRGLRGGVGEGGACV